MTDEPARAGIPRGASFLEIEVQTENGKIFEVWITKKALTTGIYIAKVRLCGSLTGMVEEVEQRRYGGTYYHGEGREWHRTIKSAVERAEQMRAKKIASLKKSLAKMEALTFE